MGPQTRDMESLFLIKHKLAESHHQRLQDFRIPYSRGGSGDPARSESVSAAKEKAMLQGSGSVSGSPGRIQENLSRDSGVGGLKEGLNTSGESENDIPRYISDSTDMSNYKRGKFLGKGGFARVHELIELSSNVSTTPSNTYAVKIIHKSRISKPYQLEKITREIELHRGLVHRNVVQFVKNFNDTENIYIVLENCSNKSLVHVLKARHVVTEPETRYYLHQLVSGVEYIHSQNIIHRDLKLGNMFLTANMALKIGDFGLATRVGAEKKFTICGTPNYLSPEVLNKEGHGFPADVWALGCVMYALLVGQPPFETSTLKETYYRIAENVYTVPGSVSPSASTLIKRLLTHSPRQRPKVSVITQDPFFSSGYFPATLPPSACRTAPVFSTSSTTSFSYTANSTKISLKQSNREVSRMTSSVSKITSSVLSLTLPDQEQQQHQQHQQQQQQRAIDLAQKPKLKTKTLSLYEALTNTLNSMPSRPSLSLTTTKESPVFITKWIDYSNRYGFGFQLSDKSIGVLFNDNTRISYSPDRSFIQFGEGVSVTTLGIHQVPVELEEKFTLLQYFAQYMDMNLTEGGETKKSATRSLTTTIPQIKRWVRTPKAIIMHLTNGTIQVNYHKDHTKLIVGGETEHILTYINSDRQSRSYFLADLARLGANPAIRERMSYVASVLEEFSELDEQIFNIF